MNEYRFSDVEDKNEWHSLMLEFIDSNIYHTWNYSKIVQKEKRIKHIAFYRQNELICIFQIRIKTLPLINRGIAYIFKGPIWQKRNKNNCINDFLLILEKLKEFYVRDQRLLLRIRPYIYSDQFAEETFDSELNPDFIRIKNLYRTLVLDLSPDLIEIRKSFRQNWRNHLNKAEKNNFYIKRGTNEDLFNDFLALYNSMMKRKKFKENINIKNFVEMINYQDENNKPKIIIAYADQRPISGIIFSAFGNTGISLFRASNEVGMKLNASYVIQFETIKWLKEMNIKRYDLGGIDMINNPNVYHFKVGVTNNEVTDFGFIEAVSDNISKYSVRSLEYFNRILKKL